MKKRMSKETFIKSEFGASWIETIKAWEFYLERHDDKETYALQSRHEAFQIAARQAYGFDYHFTRTETEYGLVTDDYNDWLFREDRPDRR